MAKIKFELSGEFEEKTVEDFAKYLGYTEDTNVSKITYVENYIKEKVVSLLSIMPIEAEKEKLYAQQEEALAQVKDAVISGLEQSVNSSSTKIE
jgi:hypothetical protein